MRFKLKRGPALSTSHGQGSLLYGGGGEGGAGIGSHGAVCKDEAMASPHISGFFHSPSARQRTLQVKAGLSLCGREAGKAGLAHRVTPQQTVFSPGPRRTTFSFFLLPSPGLPQTLEQTLLTVVHSVRPQKCLAIPTESSKDFLSH